MQLRPHVPEEPGRFYAQAGGSRISSGERVTPPSTSQGDVHTMSPFHGQNHRKALVDLDIREVSFHMARVYIVNTEYTPRNDDEIR